MVKTTTWAFRIIKKSPYSYGGLVADPTYHVEMAKTNTEVWSPDPGKLSFLSIDEAKVRMENLRKAHNPTTIVTTEIVYLDQ